MSKLRQQFIRDLQIENYSENTIRNYVTAVEKFAFYHSKCPSIIGEQEIKEYLGYVVRQNKSWSYVNIIQSALKKLYANTLNQEHKMTMIKRPKLPKTLKTIVPRSDVVKLLDNCRNIKHKVIFMVMYACGLRISEVCSIKLNDVDSARKVIQVRNPKGKKEREVKMPKELLEWMRRYYLEKKPKVYLFEGQHPGHPITTGTVDKSLKSWIKKSGIKRSFSAHDLRHTHTTHSIEEGSDPLAVKNNLGHASLNTTMVYYHLTTRLRNTLISPLETLPGYGKGKKV